jgi:hypothetical protein
MPVDFGEITAYHREEAARHYAMAQAARDRECFGEAEYQACLAARWDEAAQEQKIEMRREPARHIAYRRPSYQSPEPRRIPFTVVCWLAIRRGIKRFAQAIRQSPPERSQRIEWLSLR